MTKQSWYQTLFKKSGSKEIAKERLKLVLLHDRNDLSPQLVETIKDAMIEVLSRYVEIDRDTMDVEITRPGALDADMSAVVANIPIISVKNANPLR